MTFFIDENLPYKIAEALNILDKDNNVFSIPKYFYQGIKDEQWIVEISTLNAFVITQDTNIQKTKNQWKLFTENFIGGFFIKSSSKTGLKYWEQVKIIINNWEEIKEKAEQTKTPFAYRITSRGKMERM